MMRQTVLAIALACTIGAAAAQGAAPPLPAPNGPTGGPPAPPTPVAATPVSVSGTVERFMLNPNGDVDGL